MKVGDAVVYHDPTGEPHNALLTTAWGGSDTSAVNLVYVSGDESESDAYGRQMKRESSVSHASTSGVHGRYWRKVDEPANKRVAPSSV